MKQKVWESGIVAISTILQCSRHRTTELLLRVGSCALHKISRYQELMRGKAVKEQVTLVPFKSRLLTYFRFGEAQCASCGLSPTLGCAAT